MEFRCIKCNINVGEIIKGKKKKDIVVLCKNCYDKLNKEAFASGLNNIYNPLGNIFGGMFK